MVCDLDACDVVPGVVLERHLASVHGVRLLRDRRVDAEADGEHDHAEQRQQLVPVPAQHFDHRRHIIWSATLRRRTLCPLLRVEQKSIAALAEESSLECAGFVWNFWNRETRSGSAAAGKKSEQMTDQNIRRWPAGWGKEEEKGKERRDGVPPLG